MPNFIDIRRTLVVSSAHLNKSDINLLSNKFIHYEEYRDGYRVFYGMYNVHTESTLSKIGFSEGFIKSLLMCRVLACDRIEFDCDGLIIDGIPEYEPEPEPERFSIRI